MVEYPRRGCGLIRTGRENPAPWAAPQYRRFPWWQDAFLADWFETRLRRAEALGMDDVGTGPRGSDILDDEAYAGTEEAAPRSPVVNLAGAPAAAVSVAAPVPRSAMAVGAAQGATKAERVAEVAAGVDGHQEAPEALRAPGDNMPRPAGIASPWFDRETGKWVAWLAWNKGVRRIGVYAMKEDAANKAEAILEEMREKEWPDITLTIKGNRDRHGIHFDESRKQFRGFAVYDGNLTMTQWRDTYLAAYRESAEIRKAHLQDYTIEDYGIPTIETLRNNPKGTRALPYGRWSARVVWDRKTHHLGTYDTAEAAQKAHDDTLLEIVKRGWPSKTSEGNGVHKVGDQHYVGYRLEKNKLHETFALPTPERAREALAKVAGVKPPGARDLPAGVYESGIKYMAKIQVGGKQKYLGTFATWGEAEKAVAEARTAKPDRPVEKTSAKPAKTRRYTPWHYKK